MELRNQGEGCFDLFSLSKDFECQLFYAVNRINEDYSGVGIGVGTFSNDIPIRIRHVSLYARFFNKFIHRLYNLYTTQIF